MQPDLRRRKRFKAEAAENLQAAIMARRAAQKELEIAGQANTLNHELVTRQRGLQTQRDQLATAKLARDAAVRLRDETEEQLRVTETAHQATRLRADLSLGDACPVCDTPITELPPTDEPIESELAMCHAAATEARDSATRSEKEVSALEARLVSGESAVEDIETKLRNLGRLSPLAEAQEAERLRRAAEKEAQARLDEAGKTLGELKQQLADDDARIAGSRQRGLPNRTHSKKSETGWHESETALSPRLASNCRTLQTSSKSGAVDSPMLLPFVTLPTNRANVQRQPTGTRWSGVPQY